MGTERQYNTRAGCIISWAWRGGARGHLDATPSFPPSSTKVPPRGRPSADTSLHTNSSCLSSDRLRRARTARCARRVRRAGGWAAGASALPHSVRHAAPRRRALAWAGVCRGAALPGGACRGGGRASPRRARSRSTAGRRPPRACSPRCVPRQARAARGRASGEPGAQDERPSMGCSPHGGAAAGGAASCGGRALGGDAYRRVAGADCAREASAHAQVGRLHCPLRARLADDVRLHHSHAT